MQLSDPDAARRTGVAVFLYVFDLLRLEGEDLRELPLRERKARLRRALSFHGPVRFTPHRNERGEELFREACQKGLEGVIAKRADSPYRGSRSRDWLKFKCHAEQELVIGGFTAPKGSRTEFGALLVGYYEDGDLRYAGKVGTGFDRETLADLGRRHARARAGRAAVRRRPPDPARHALGSARAGGSGRLQRVDPRRAAAPPALSRAARRQARPRGGTGASAMKVEITHPEKVLFPDDGITKADLASYYERVSEWMLPHVKGRPLSLQRFPDGIDKKGFFHKDIPDYFPDWVRRVEVPKAGGTVTHAIVTGRRHARVPGGPEHDHPACMALARGPRSGSRTGSSSTSIRPAGDFAAVRRAAALDGRAACGSWTWRPSLRSPARRGSTCGPRCAGALRIRRGARVRPRTPPPCWPSATRTSLTVEMRKAKREGRILVDVARNAYAQTAVPPYAVRPRPGAPVATPIDWDELSDSKLRPDRWTVKTVLRRLAAKGDPWEDIQSHARGLAKARRKLAALR